ALLLIDPPHLFGSDDEFAKKRLGDPARKARRQAITQMVPLDALFLVREFFLELRAVLGRQLRARRRVVRDLRIEPRATVMRPDARPVGKFVPRHLGAATGFLLQLEELLFRQLVPLVVLLGIDGSWDAETNRDDGDASGYSSEQHVHGDSSLSANSIRNRVRRPKFWGEPAACRRRLCPPSARPLSS